MENNHQPVRNTSIQIASTPQEQLLFLKQFGSIYFWLHVFAALLLCILAFTEIVTGNPAVFIWFCTVVILATAYWLVNSRFTQDALMEEQLRRYRIISILLCVAWGLSGLLLFSDDPVSQAIHLCILLIIAISIWPMSLISAKIFQTQLALLLIPITIMLALQQNSKTNLLCFVILAFVTITVLMTKIFRRILDALLNKEQSLIGKISIDPVTHLMSSRNFDQILKQEWRRSARDRQPLSLIMVEIDGFREMENQLDTKEVKKYLKTVADSLRTVARRGSDTLAHYDYVDANFAVLLPGTSEKDATEMAKLLKQKIVDTALPNPIALEQIIQASVGVSSCEPVMRTTDKRRHAILGEAAYPASLVKSAKQALKQQQKTTTIE